MKNTQFLKKFRKIKNDFWMFFVFLFLGTHKENSKKTVFSEKDTKIFTHNVIGVIVHGMSEKGDYPNIEQYVKYSLLYKSYQQ